MSPALEVIGLHKRFSAGAGSCLATNSVLRGVDLEVRHGEAVTIVGEPASGRSTLLLCIAGLLAADHGIVRVFGKDGRASAANRTRHYLSVEQLAKTGDSDVPLLHLLDLRDFAALKLRRLRRWLDDQCRRGHAALVVANSVEMARRMAPRVLLLRDGRLHALARMPARVAESRFVDRPFERV